MAAVLPLLRERAGEHLLDAQREYAVGQTARIEPAVKCSAVTAAPSLRRNHNEVMIRVCTVTSQVEN